MDIILYLFNFIKYQQKIICQLLNFICKYIPLKQWAFDDSHSPKYQKFKIDELPKLISFKQNWIWTDLIYYYEQRYSKTIRPVFRRVECDIPADCCCPKCEAPVQYLTWNDGKRKAQILCKVCQSHFSNGDNNVLIATTLLHLKRIVNTLLFTNVLILNVLTISEILTKQIKRTLPKNMAKINTSSTTSIVNSRQISLRWI